MFATKNRKALLFGSLVIISVFAVVRLGVSISAFYTFKHANTGVLRPVRSSKSATGFTELPDVDLSGLTHTQKVQALKLLNTKTCDCGCKLTVANCRVNDTTCPISKVTADKIVNDFRAAGTTPR
jgi:hypothetical protein